MNARVNLILPTEQRSGSVITVPMLARLVAIAIPTLILMGILVAVWRFKTAESDLRESESLWRTLEPQYITATGMREDLASRRAVMNEIQGWRQARVNWHQQLGALQTAIPADIQLTDVTMDDLVQIASNKALRIFRMRMKGRTGGADAEANVTSLREALATHGVFTQYIENVEIPPGGFGQDPSPLAARSDRLFEIVCRYRPREFE